VKTGTKPAVAAPADELRINRIGLAALLLAAISSGALAGAFLALRTLAEALP
jgi:hypothetical protein